MKKCQVWSDLFGGLLLKKAQATNPKQFSITLLSRPVVYLLALTINKGILALLLDSWEILVKFQYPPAVWGVKLPMRGQLPLAHPWQSLLTLKGIPSASQAEPRALLLQEQGKELLHRKAPAQPGHGTLAAEGHTRGLTDWSRLGNLHYWQCSFCGL